MPFGFGALKSFANSAVSAATNVAGEAAKAAEAAATQAASTVAAATEVAEAAASQAAAAAGVPRDVRSLVNNVLLQQIGGGAATGILARTFV